MEVQNIRREGKKQAELVPNGLYFLKSMYDEHKPGLYGKESWYEIQALSFQLHYSKEMQVIQQVRGHKNQACKEDEDGAHRIYQYPFRSGHRRSQQLCRDYWKRD